MAGSFKKRAEKGFNFMNDLISDWKASVDAEKLDMGSETDCIFGQVFGDFDTGYKMICKLYQEKYKIPEDDQSSSLEWWEWLTKYGFAIYRKPDDAGNSYAYPRGRAFRIRNAALTQAWKELLGTSPA